MTMLLPWRWPDLLAIALAALLAGTLLGWGWSVRAAGPARATLVVAVTAADPATRARLATDAARRLAHAGWPVRRIEGPAAATLVFGNAAPPELPAPVLLVADRLPVGQAQLFATLLTGGPALQATAIPLATNRSVTARLVALLLMLAALLAAAAIGAAAIRQRRDILRHLHQLGLAAVQVAVAALTPVAAGVAAGGVGGLLLAVPVAGLGLLPVLLGPPLLLAAALGSAGVAVWREVTA